jgi:hypothetical protein
MHTLRAVLLTACLGLGLAHVTRATSAFAAGADPASATPVEREQAQSLYAKGRELYAAQRFPEALDAFGASLEIVASPNTRLYAARAEREMGRTLEAYADFGRTVVDAREKAGDDSRYARTAAAALEEREALGRTIGFIMVRVEGAGDRPALFVNGHPVSRAGWDEPIPVASGANEVVVESEGQRMRLAMTLAPGESRAVTFDAESGAELRSAPLAAPTPAAPPAPPTPTPTPTAMTSRPPTPTQTPTPSGPPYRAIGVGLTGAGALGLGTFAVAGLLARGTYADLAASCNGPCRAAQKGEVDRGRAEQTVANAALAVGVVALGAGVTLFVLGSAKSSAPSAAAIRVTPSGASFEGRF